ncbi:MAG TPA: CPCC family cysteine-rich protein [Archangium sp.]|nr:CPCC family cysteine-rich protein [Archangium sp.]
MAYEDDELGDSEPEMERGGPNHVSLMTARLNFLTFGAAEREMLPHVRPPREDDVRVRVFVIEDGRVVERSR